MINKLWYEENISIAALHKIIVENKYQPPTNKNRIIGYGVELSEIQKLYKWPLSVTKNTKLIMFQLKINHYIIYTKNKLKIANIIPDDLCHLCKSEQHTIQHMSLKARFHPHALRAFIIVLKWQGRFWLAVTRWWSFPEFLMSQQLTVEAPTYCQRSR